MILIIIAFLLGIIIGIITGLLPGIHTNLVSVFLLSISPFLLDYFSPFAIATFIISLAISNLILEFLPAIFFGAPEESTVLGIMPGHYLLLNQKGHSAVSLAMSGAFLALLLSIILVPIFIFIIPKIYPFLQRMMGFILILFSIFLIFRDKERIIALTFFIISGFLGIATLNLNVNQSLLPMLSGLFGSSALIYSISQKTKIPEQKIEKIEINKKSLIKPAIATILVSPVCSFLPGLGNSQAALLGSEIIKMSKEEFMIFLGSINMIVMSMSFFAVYIIQKSRTGAAAAVSQLISPTLLQVVYFFIIILLSLAISVFIAFNLSKFLAKNINHFNYSKTSFIILAIIIIAVIAFSGFLGLFIFIVSTLLGLACLNYKTGMGHLLGCLLVPTILFYLPF